MHTSNVSFAPVSLSYIAALRGFKPRQPGEAFTYALVNCTSPELLMGLAASNPEGKFFGLISDASACAAANAAAAERQVDNISYMNMTIANFVKGSEPLPALDYIACDESQKPLTHIERAALFDLATTCLKPNGLMCYTYRAYDNADAALRFLVREFAPEMNVEQASDFLLEIKKLGQLYFKTNADLLAKLNQAIAKNMPDEFFALFDTGEVRSPTFDTLVALRTRGMTYAGAGQIAANYVELSVPVEAQNIVIECTENPLYQSIKDFAALNAVRSDIWCKQPVTMSSNPVELFGGFAYGVTESEDKVPMSFDVFGKSVDLSLPIYRELIKLMAMQPAGIGDFLQYPSGKNFAAEEVVQTLQILVALGIARPMRGAREDNNVNTLAQPRFSGNFNRHLATMSISGDTLPMASRVMGDVVSVSPRDVLVMQALNRAGLANSVSALLPELERLAKDPASSARVTEIAEPTAETAHQMINDAVSKSIVQWYAYGLLEAA